jgi:hypothetical protein
VAARTDRKQVITSLDSNRYPDFLFVGYIPIIPNNRMFIQSAFRDIEPYFDPNEA